MTKIHRARKRSRGTATRHGTSVRLCGVISSTLRARAPPQTVTCGTKGMRSKIRGGMVILESHSQTTPDSSRHVPRVIEHDSRVISTRYHAHSHLRLFIHSKKVKTADSREKLCRSTPDASVSAQDAYWAPHTPTPTMRRLGSGRILHRVTREAVTHTTARPGCLSSI